jgi:hypothetical protein
MSPALAIAGPVVGASVVAALAALLHRTARPALEIERYSDDVLAAARGIERSLAALEELERTRALANRLATALGSRR